ncbi:nucleoid-associated protein [Pseudomonas sp. MUP55]|uniref:nucleoid-associated protein n=1 Tax=Pseudomonas sp. MUP55 TaxID=3087234 RepID=UPI002A59C85C|nr:MULTISPECIES: nucleoid-associated protein [unclassified Pseudomonas]WPN94281.1 nucleoid-associated protein [Pseudomonas sp. MUP56]WPN99808.1 nucleoid-associated protein [Pseudomonas sp. MUP55]
MDTKVNFAVVHELVKEQYKDILDSNIRNVVFDLAVPAVSKLIEGAVGIYGKKNNNAHYGTFAKKTASEYPKDFHAYFSRPDLVEKSFMELTQSAMAELHATAKPLPAASGGYILFVDYESAQGRFFLIAMLKKRDGLRLNENLEPEELIELDLNSLYQAARINFERYGKYVAADEGERLELNYLSFLSQTSGRSAAGYFVNSLGCMVGSASSQSTKNLILESTQFFRERPDLYPHRLEMKDQVLHYLDKKRESGDSVKLTEVEAIARQFFPATYEGQADDLAGEFVAHLNSEAVGVPVEFPLSKAMLQKYTHVSFKAENWQLKFDRDALGEDVNSEVLFLEKDRKLILNNLSEEAVVVIRAAINEKKDEKVNK